MERHADAAYGGFSWVLDGWRVRDGAKQCYAAAFAVQAVHENTYISISTTW